MQYVFCLLNITHCFSVFKLVKLLAEIDMLQAELHSMRGRC